MPRSSQNQNWATFVPLEEKSIGARMRLGDLLVGANLVTVEDVAAALERQAGNGARLGDNLAALGAIDKQVLDAFLKRIPAEPADLAATGIEEIDLLSLLMKLIYTGHLETCRQFVEAIKLPYHVVAELVQMAVDRQLLRNLGMRDSARSPVDMSYAFTEEGKRWAIDALERMRYAGPAPVTLEEFTFQVNLQKLTNELVTFERIRKAIGELSFEDSMIEQCGPALNSGRAMLLYGPPGNGKTSVAHCLGSVFSDVIYIPYAIDVEGQIIRFHDPSLHTQVSPTELSDEGLSFIRAEEYDARWVPCHRPFVVTGGELTLEMLDLRYETTGHYYEAPLHVKALGGCFVIDDFGRQLVSPTSLLNRWIVPLENRIDYLKLHTGKSFSIPFEELVIFSTNLEPEDLMDPAFLRRLPYKIEVGAPSVEIYRRIFDGECKKQGITLPDEVFDFVVYKLKKDKGMDLAAYQPKFIVDQVVATCRFMGQPPHFEPRFVEYALNNLRVHRNAA
ncbi:MAG: hypothetical protein ABSF70_15670 [Terracidiphilus sp.]|jgi:hypothetical protein